MSLHCTETRAHAGAPMIPNAAMAAARPQPTLHTPGARWHWRYIQQQGFYRQTFHRLLLLALAVNAANVASTWLLLRVGGHEANPLLAAGLGLHPSVVGLVGWKCLSTALTLLAFYGLWRWLWDYRDVVCALVLAYCGVFAGAVFLEGLQTWLRLAHLL